MSSRVQDIFGHFWDFPGLDSRRSWLVVSGRLRQRGSWRGSKNGPNSGSTVQAIGVEGQKWPKARKVSYFSAWGHFWLIYRCLGGP